MLDGHILYMFHWIVLYVSCTKINVSHLSTDIICLRTQRLTIVYGAASSLDYKLRTPWKENTHTNTHTYGPRTNAMEDRTDQNIVCVRRSVCAGKI